MILYKTLKIPLTFALALALQACQSEIDKCVDDNIKAYDAKPWGPLVKEEERKSKRLDVIVEFRVFCMQVAK
jgi:hypothetical protein